MCLVVGCGGSPPPKGKDAAAMGGSGGSGGSGGGGGSGGTGGNNNSDAAGDAPVAQRTVRVNSSPVRSVMVGEPMRYRVIATDPNVTFQALELPEGATLDSAGNMFWIPTEMQTGIRRVAVKVQAGDESVMHEFNVNVGVARRQRVQAVDPNAPEATSITVDAPLSGIRGAGVQIESGSLIASGEVEVTIAEVENAPMPPLVRRVPPGDLKPVELGPSGTAFRKAARVQLPVSAKVLERGTPVVMTIDPATGAWERAKFLDVDKEQGLVTAEIEHFSTYVAVPDESLLEGKLSRGGAGTACARSLILRTAIAGSPGELPAEFVNGYKGDGATLKAVLETMTAGQALQVFLDATARANDGPSERGWLLMTVIKTEGGSFRVSVTGSQQSGPFLRLPDTMNLDEAVTLLAGRNAHLIFNGLGALEKGVSVTVEVSLYLVDGADAERPPVNPVNPVARETFAATAEQLLHDVADATGFDKDCDQAPDSQDMDPDGEPPPQIFGQPASPVRLLVGQTAPLKVVTDAPDVTFTWKASDATVQLSGSDGSSNTVTPSQTGVYQVVVIARRGTAESRFLWDVLVDAMDTKAMNTPPEVKIASSAAVARVGETVWLLAVGRDREQPQLRFSWQASDPSVLANSYGPRIPFLAGAPGDYKVSCVASDGMADSAPATLVITVVAPTTNRPPEAPAVWPLSAMVKHAPGEIGSVTLTARSVDPDGDPVTFDFVPDPSVSRAVALKKDGNKAVVSSVVDGVFVFYVTAQDPQGATSRATAVKVQFLPADAIVVGAVDNDRDGHPAGVDCNDGDITIFPGAREACTDTVDKNCDGRVPAGGECDGDGDRFTTAMGDCNDNNPRQNPNMPEFCDGVDNNCNAETDEIFKVNEPCYVGTGACRMAGVTRCSATLVGAVCDVMAGATPVRPTPETCDGVDNDCNGRVDDVPSQTVGTETSCGGCGVVCPVPQQGAARCVAGGCVALCSTGYVDLDRDPTNGCECRIEGPEICDNKDNNCNGLIDDGITEKVDSSSTLGACTGGYKVCRGGVMVEERAARLPTSEVCDGLDNDCNGKVDELFSFATDPRNCGGCGINCGIDGKCDSGRCVGGTTPTLPPPPPPSGGGGAVQVGICPLAGGGTTCVDLMSDPAHCGGCGKVCGQGMFCGLGACVPLDKLPAGTRPPPVIYPECPRPPPPTGGGDAGAGGCPLEMPDVCKSPAGDAYCTNLRFDNASCGACGVPCPAGAFCRDGRCATGTDSGSGGTVPPPTCREPFKLCSDPFGGTYCTDLLHDGRNCGGCGNTCREGTYCKEGACTAGDAPPPSTCPPPGTGCDVGEGKIVCFDLQYNNDNCGACGNRCMDGSYCKGGTCVSGAPPATGCTPPLATCKLPDRMYCADIFHDNGNCGACGHFCGEGNYCKEGTCVQGVPPPPPCEFPGTICKGPRGEPICRDTFRDPANCGGCDQICPQGTFCKEGSCYDGAPPPPTCGPPLAQCKDLNGYPYCADPMSDPRHCGGCDNRCPDGTRCYQGACQEGAPAPTCGPPRVICKGPAGEPVCVDLKFDQLHCGQCEKSCPDTMHCADGVCQEGPPAPPMCPPEQPLCKDPAGRLYCADIRTDPYNCGQCDNHCAQGTYCQEGVCQAAPPPTCPPERPLCKDPAGRLYCADIRTDPYNCGRCDNHCPPGAYCQDGACAEGTPPPPTCETPRVMCMDLGGGSRCVDTKFDAKHCGSCGTACPPEAPYCADGRCGTMPPPPPPMMSCQPPKTACSPPGGTSYCADLNYDRYNCGACGYVCPGGAPCEAGRCLPPPLP